MIAYLGQVSSQYGWWKSGGVVRSHVAARAEGVRLAKSAHDALEDEVPEVAFAAAADDVQTQSAARKAFPTVT
jgi:hypothetical protein